VSVEEDVRVRIAQLVAQSHPLSVGNENGQCVDERQQQACSAWLTVAQNTVHLICTASNLSRDKIKRPLLSPVS
jgi:hypothetical protein